MISAIPLAHHAPPPRLDELAKDYCSGNKGLAMKVGRLAKKLSQQDVQQLCSQIRAHGKTPSASLHRLELGQPEAIETGAGNGNGNGESHGHNGTAHGSPFHPGEGAAKPPAGSAKPPAKKERIYWSDDDWQFIANGVMQARLTEPAASIYLLAERMIAQMPPENRRKVSAGIVEKVATLMVAANQRCIDLAAEVELLREQVEGMKAPLTEEEVLQTLTREEICRRFGDVVLEGFTADDLCAKFSIDTIISCLPTPALMAHTMIRTLETFTAQSRQMDETMNMLGRILADMPAEKLHRQQQAIATVVDKLPRVCLVGFKQDQGAFLGDALRNKAKVEVYNKNRTRFESNADIVVVWGRFVDHALKNSVTKNHKPGGIVIYHDNHDEGGRGLRAALVEIERVLHR